MSNTIHRHLAQLFKQVAVELPQVRSLQLTAGKVQGEVLDQLKIATPNGNRTVTIADVAKNYSGSWSALQQSAAFELHQFFNTKLCSDALWAAKSVTLTRNQ